MAVDAPGNLVHYVAVRRDLPLGVALAQVVHAAGESFFQFARRETPGSPVAPSSDGLGVRPSPGTNTGERMAPPQGGGGARPSPGATLHRGSSASEHPASAGGSGVQLLPAVPPFDSFDPSRTVAVALGVRDEAALLKLERRLLRAGVPHVSIREPDPPYAGQLMALGLEPTGRDAVRRHLKKLLPVR